MPNTTPDICEALFFQLTFYRSHGDLFAQKLADQQLRLVKSYSTKGKNRYGQTRDLQTDASRNDFNNSRH